MCYQDIKDYPIPIPKQVDPGRLISLQMAYETLISLEPREIVLSDAYRETYTRFYLEMEAVLDDPLLDEGTKALLARLQTDYFLKFTIIDCATMGLTEATGEVAARVCYLINFYASQVKQVIAHILKTDIAKNEEKVLLYLEHKESASSTDLHRLFGNNLNSSQLNSIMRTLEDAGDVVSKKDGRLKMYQMANPVAVVH